jgi:RHS repeat-associated protein
VPDPLRALCEKVGILTFFITSSTTNYSFDSAGAYTIQYGYDAASNRTSLVNPQGQTTTYAYDSLNRLNNLNDNGQSFGFSYDPLSRRTQLTRPNGVNTNYSYDNLSRLLSVLHQVGVTTLDGATYTYDAAGNRLSKADQRTGVASGFAYDAIYQLTGVAQGATTTESYTYDPVGNRLSSLGMSPYSYNSSNQLTSTPTTTYTYDKNGNVKTKVDASGTTTYNWDVYRNVLSSVVLPGTGGTVTFKYDPFGRRVQKSGPGGTVDYLYDGANILQEVDQSGNVLARYTHGPMVDEPLAELRSGTTSYYQRDGLGSVSSLSTAAGSLTNTYSYDSFGNATASTGSISNPFRYTGREFDSEAGIYQYRARYYDPSVGRFMSEDPVWYGTFNLYNYVGGNPVNYTDPSGRRKVYGNWCGPNWTGAQSEPYNPAHDNVYKPPIDNNLDTVCMNHDKCYFRCRKDHPCSVTDRQNCMRDCDKTLINDVPDTTWGTIVKDGIKWFNKNPEAGTNEECGCKEKKPK